ncbi:MAG: PEP-CTERM sorting domain-containing protein [Armatimonadetes bacterium]|nr:MAG: PEP-CTERM sorting domain-containing protein [Armatimonadota bacterium]
MAAPAFPMLFRRRGDAMKTENFRYGSIVLLALGAACLGQAQSVSFSQVNWADGSGGYLAGGLNGDWAHARIDFATSAGFTAGPGGQYQAWLNMVTSVPLHHTNKWSVMNMPVVVRSLGDFGTDSFFDVFFDLDASSSSNLIAGADVPELFYTLSLSANPLSSAPGAAATQAFVTDRDFVVGGLYEPSIGLFGGTGDKAEAPGSAFDPVGGNVGDQIGASGNASNSVTKPIEAVNEAKNFCAPGAFGRSLKYLGDVHSIAGLSSRTAQQHANGLASNMGTTTTNGTLLSNTIPGKTAYLQSIGMAGRVRTTTTTSFAHALEQLNDRQDVEILFNYGTDSAGRRAGHAAMVKQIVPIKNAQEQVTGYKVITVQDGKQGDGQAENFTQELTFNPNGSLRGRYGNLNGDGGLYNFVIECPVPEPSSMVALAVGLIAISRRRNTRSRSR